MRKAQLTITGESLPLITRSIPFFREADGILAEHYTAVLLLAIPDSFDFDAFADAMRSTPGVVNVEDTEIPVAKPTPEALAAYIESIEADLSPRVSWAAAFAASPHDDEHDSSIDADRAQFHYEQQQARKEQRIALEIAYPLPSPQAIAAYVQTLARDLDPEAARADAYEASPYRNPDRREADALSAAGLIDGFLESYSEGAIEEHQERLQNRDYTGPRIPAQLAASDEALAAYVRALALGIDPEEATAQAYEASPARGDRTKQADAERAARTYRAALQHHGRIDQA